MFKGVKTKKGQQIQIPSNNMQVVISLKKMKLVAKADEDNQEPFVYLWSDYQGFTSATCHENRL